MSVGEAHVLYHEMFYILLCQAVRHHEPERQRAVAVAGSGTDTELAACCLVPASQHEELAAVYLSLVSKPLGVAKVAVGFKVMMNAPLPLRAEA